MPEQPYDAEMDNWIIYSNGYDSEITLMRVSGYIYVIENLGYDELNPSEFGVSKSLFQYTGGQWVERANWMTRRIASPNDIIACSQPIIFRSDDTEYDPIEDTVVYYEYTPPETYTTYTLNTGDSITMKNNNINPSVLVEADYINASFETVYVYEGQAPQAYQSTNVTSYGETIEIEHKQEHTIWKITQGEIIIRVPDSANMYVNVTRDTQTPPDDPFNYINPPKRSDYDSSIFGSIAYAMDYIIYFIGYPFIAFTYIIEKFQLYITTLLSKIGSMNSVMSSMVSWLPPEFVGILILGVVVGVILKILGR